MKSPQKIQQANRLANQSERLSARNRLPKPWLAHYQRQQKLDALWRALTADTLGDAASLCQVVRFCEGKLVVSTPNQTLANHLRFLAPSLIDALKRHPDFANLRTLRALCLSA